MNQATDTFIQDVQKGLLATPKCLPSKYFYDDEGSKIFQAIMHMESYYLTDCEMDILSNQAHSIYQALSFNQPFNVVEFGAGDGEKTMKLLSYFSSLGLDYTYTPVDISWKALDALRTRLIRKLPLLKVQPIIGDYHILLEENKLIDSELPSLCLFLGSNIGNYAEQESIRLLERIFKSMKEGDKFLLGVDLKKNPRVIHKAYNDKEGITKSFNLNLLRRINMELGACFEIDLFDFYSSYSLESGEVRSYLFSMEDQDVWIDALGASFHFDACEWIHTETSKKYSLSEVERIMSARSFEFIKHFIDGKGYFADSLFVKS